MSKAKIAAAVYAVLTGVAMLGTWAMLLTTGRVPELSTTPVVISLHIAAEILTALALLIGGYGLLTGRKWGRPLHLVSLGMLLYAVVQASGYYAQQGETVLVGMFAVFAITTVVFIGLAIRRRNT